MFHGSQVALGSRRVGVTLSLLAQASITAIPERHLVTRSFTSMVTTLELFTALWACWYTCAGHSEVLLGGDFRDTGAGREDCARRACC